MSLLSDSVPSIVMVPRILVVPVETAVVNNTHTSAFTNTAISETILLQVLAEVSETVSEFAFIIEATCTRLHF